MAFLLENNGMCACTVRSDKSDSKLEVVKSLGYISDNGEAYSLYDTGKFEPGLKLTCANVWLLKNGYETIGVYKEKETAIEAYDDILAEMLAAPGQTVLIKMIKDDSPSLRTTEE